MVIPPLLVVTAVPLLLPAATARPVELLPAAVRLPVVAVTEALRVVLPAVRLLVATVVRLRAAMAALPAVADMVLRPAVDSVPLPAR